MKNRSKKLLSVFLSAVLLLGIIPAFSLPASAYAVGDTIQYGTYPQTKVTDEDLISAFEAVPKTWRSYRYYSGTGAFYDGLMEPGDWMCYADFFYDGYKYRAVYFDEYRPYYTGMLRDNSYSYDISKSYQDDNGYTIDTCYYFKYEPITW